jgi:(1->4)-alpha-D-glucan 1-alpha-D-glucosylmutase
MRLAAISHHFDEWVRLTKEWRTANRRLKAKIDGVPSPDANDEYVIYQTVISLLPADGVNDELRGRLSDYLLKALREAKRHTGWLNPDERYEKAALAFMSRMLDQIDGGSSDFAQQFTRYAAQIRDIADVLLVGRVVLRLTMPGVPDTYQGTELYDLTLVDPDNRRAVDYERRTQMLASIGPTVDKRIAVLESNRSQGEKSPAPLPERGENAKFAAMHLVLQLRRARPELFLEGEFKPLSVTGPGHRSYVAFLRGEGELLVVVRCAPGPTDGSAPTRLHLSADAPRRFYDLWSGDELWAEDGAVDLREALEGRSVVVAVAR